MYHVIIKVLHVWDKILSFIKCTGTTFTVKPTGTSIHESLKSPVWHHIHPGRTRSFLPILNLSLWPEGDMRGRYFSSKHHLAVLDVRLYVSPSSVSHDSLRSLRGSGVSLLVDSLTLTSEDSGSHVTGTSILTFQPPVSSLLSPDPTCCGEP